jgi:hypothetical protein
MLLERMRGAEVGRTEAVMGLLTLATENAIGSRGSFFRMGFIYGIRTSFQIHGIYLASYLM